jgi:hypothetical protein
LLPWFVGATGSRRLNLTYALVESVSSQVPRAETFHEMFYGNAVNN